MSYRYMRVIVMFDLPMQSSYDIRNYNQFRRYLIKMGFLMMQQSVYCKLALNMSVVNSIVENLRQNHPDKGLVEVFSLTENQFSKIEFLVGERDVDVISDDRRLVIL